MSLTRNSSKLFTPWSIPAAFLVIFVLVLISRQIVTYKKPLTGMLGDESSIVPINGSFNEDEVISFNVKDSNVRDVLVNFAQMEDLSLIMTQDVEGKVTLTGDPKSCRQILDELCRQANCTWDVWDRKQLVVVVKACVGCG